MASKSAMLLPPRSSPSSEQPHTRRRRETRHSHHGRSQNTEEYGYSTSAMPDALRSDSEDSQTDSEQESGKGGRGEGGLQTDGRSTFVAQSMYGMVAAAQSQSVFAEGYAPEMIEESDSDGEGEQDSRAVGKDRKRDVKGRSVDLDRSGKKKTEAVDDAAAVQGGQRRKESQAKLLSGLMRPSRRKSGGSQRQSSDFMTQSQFLPPREEKRDIPGRPASAEGHRQPPKSITDRKLQARRKAEAESPSLSSSLHKAKDGEEGDEHEDNSSRTPRTLPQALAQIFGFPEPEDVLAEHASWYMQNVLLQGSFYITKRHLCFYSHLPKKGSATLKSGQLSKRGPNNPRYRRYWFTLKGDVLTYYTSANEPYFPRGTIDLRHAITAELAPEKTSSGQKHDAPTPPSVAFDLITPGRTHHFKADSAPSAKEWVRQLQKVIFRSHNDGDSVKICLPIANVVEVEPTTIINMAETAKIKVIDDPKQVDWTVDEYFFTFFSRGKDALGKLEEVTADTEAKKIVSDQRYHQNAPFRGQRPATPTMREGVRATLSPTSAGGPGSRPSSSDSRRSSLDPSRSSLDKYKSSPDGGRRSTGKGLRRFSRSPQSHTSPVSPSVQASTESLVTSSEQPTDDEGQLDAMSASQMLSGDRAFGAPTIRSPQPRRPATGAALNKMRQGSPSPTPPERMKVQPPSRTLTEEALPAANSDAPDRRGSEQAQVQQQSRSSFEALRPARFASPFQHASNLADYVRKQGKAVTSYLGTGPMTYYDKVSGAIAGGTRHYSEADALISAEEGADDPERGLSNAEHERRFREHFALPRSERLMSTFYTSFHRVLPLYGKIYLGSTRLCFRSLLYGTRTKIVIPIKDIDNVEKEKGLRLRYAGMVLVIRGHEELFFDFRSLNLRNECVVTILRALDGMAHAGASMQESIMLTEDEMARARAADEEQALLQDAARSDGLAAHQSAETPEDVTRNAAELASADLSQQPILFDDLNASFVDFRPKESLRITCLTIGSRGDVQPYIALCKGLLADGHRPIIATHAEFEGWVRRHGIEFAPVEGNPAELMQLCVEKGMFTPGFLMETNNMRDWLENLLESAWHACQGADVLIESPSAMCGIHIAEALGVPYFRAFTMPWTRTRAYPHAFANQFGKMGGAWNMWTYVLMENMFWAIIAGQVNRWRRRTLRLGPTSLEKLQPNKVPFLYNFSPSVVVPPLDFSDWIRVTGYWFLDEGAAWTPPDDLRDFIDKARRDKVKLVYIGFGSVVVANARKMTQGIVDAVLKADVRCILSKGWSERLSDTSTTGSSEPEVQLPDCIFTISSAPHDWLFRQIDAAVHHGGAGTTGASLRAGVPTIAKPFFGDQFFFAKRIEDLGVGISLEGGITGKRLGRALWVATRDERMREKARLLGEQIRSEDGVGNAVKAIYRDMEYAKSLVKRPREAAATAAKQKGHGVGGDGANDGAEDEDEEEEAWTFIEPDSGVEDLGLTERRQGPQQWRSQGQSWAQASLKRIHGGGGGGGGAHARQGSLVSNVLKH